MLWNWKRKKTESGYKGQEKRAHPRFHLPPDRPVVVMLEGEEYAARDISRGGIAFVGRRYRIGESLACTLRLGRRAEPVSLSLTVVDVDFEQVCHARFHRFAAGHQALLEVFVAELERHQLGQTGERRLVTDDDL